MCNCSLASCSPSCIYANHCLRRVTCALWAAAHLFQLLVTAKDSKSLSGSAAPGSISWIAFLGWHSRQLLSVCEHMHINRLVWHPGTKNMLLWEEAEAQRMGLGTGTTQCSQGRWGPAVLWVSGSAEAPAPLNSSSLCHNPTPTVLLVWPQEDSVTSEYSWVKECLLP